MGNIYGVCAQCNNTFSGMAVDAPIIYLDEKYTQSTHICQSCRDANREAMLVIDNDGKGMCINCKGISHVAALHEMPTIYVGLLQSESYIHMAYFCDQCRKKHISWAIKAIDEYINEDE